MTLDEAIQHCRDKENCSQCGQEHKQLREWLEELKDLRSQYNLPKPHGRLIDADAHIQSLKENQCGERCRKNYDCVNCGIGMYIRIVENEPAVIEAEA